MFRPTPRRARAARTRGAVYVEFLVLVALLGLGVMTAVRYLSDGIGASADDAGAHVAALATFSPEPGSAKSAEPVAHFQPIAARGLEQGEDEDPDQGPDPADSPGHEFDHAENEHVPEDDSPNLWDRAKAYGGALLQKAPELLADTVEVGTGVAAGVAGVQTAGEGAGIAVAGSETVVAVPVGAGIAVAGGALAIAGVKVAGEGLQHFSEDVQQAKNNADQELAPEPTRPLPKGEPNPSAKARGTPEEVPRASRQMQENIARQNESADRLAQEGYDIEHWGKAGDKGGKPDYKINGQYVDHFNARSGSLDNVRKELVKKVGNQADRLVVRLDDSPLSIEDVKNMLSNPNKAVTGLKEVILIEGDTITSYLP